MWRWPVAVPDAWITTVRRLLIAALRRAAAAIVVVRRQWLWRDDRHRTGRAGVRRIKGLLLRAGTAGERRC
jgi:hypothetical protein